MDDPVYMYNILLLKPILLSTRYCNLLNENVRTRNKINKIKIWMGGGV